MPVFSSKKSSERWLWPGVLLLVLVGLIPCLVSIPTQVDSGNGYDSAEQAARLALIRHNPQSIEQNIELGGYIYRLPSGRYHSTSALRGDHGSINFPEPGKLLPKGATVIATWHTHGAAAPNLVSETFSPQDIKLNQKYKIDGYLGTPSGQLKHYLLNNPDIELLGHL